MLHESRSRSWRVAQPAGFMLFSVSVLAVLAATSDVRAADIGRQDVLHTVLARRMLLQDDKLAPFNLGVTVRNRAAVIWGTVPTVELARRAQALVRSAPEFVEVRNELRIDPGEAIGFAPGSPQFLPGPHDPPKATAPAVRPPPEPLKQDSVKD